MSLKKRIAINGFGRIGRILLRQILQKNQFDVVLINDLADIKTCVHLFQYDTGRGVYPGKLECNGNQLIVDGQKITFLQEREISRLPWNEYKVDLVVECTGVHRDRLSAEMHLAAGARHVIISAPPKDKDISTLVLGVNDKSFSVFPQIISNASCTTNCAAPLIQIIMKYFEIEQLYMSTTHSYTADQNLQDAPHKDLRRARAATQNLVPTTTGAADALFALFPQLKNKLVATSVRVPVICGSLLDLVFFVKENTKNKLELNSIFQSEAETHLKGILRYNTDPIVSSDILGDGHSAILDAELTEVSGNMIKITAWYDNEFGYASRLADLCEII
jgi:glyceraldehyde 3-phosphate dehydrogenase